MTAPPRMSRVAAPDVGSNALGLTTWWLSFGRPALAMPAVVVPGSAMGGPEWRRMIEGCDLYNNSESRAGNLLVAGVHPKEPERHLAPMTPLDLIGSPFNLDPGRLAGVLVQGEADHSLHQGQWLAQQIARRPHIWGFTLHVTPYHILRQLLTILQQLKVAGAPAPNGFPEFVIVPMPTDVAPDEVSPESSLRVRDMVAGEIGPNRLPLYQEKGDALDFETAWRYLAWLRNQEVIRNAPRFC